MFMKTAIGLISLICLVFISGCSFREATQPPASTAAPNSNAAEASAPVPATFQMQWLRISPAVLYPGDRVTITASVMNTGAVDANYSVELKINSVVDQVAEVAIAAGTAQSFSLFVWNDEPGTYDVALGQFSGQFVIVKPGTPKPVLGPSAGPGGTVVPPCCR